MPSFRPRPARSLRRLPRRRPHSAIPWWLGVLALASLTAATVHGALAKAAAAEARWTSTRSVVVATRALAAGDPLEGVVTMQRLPAVAVPDGALATAPVDRVATAAIGRGEVVTAARVSGEEAAGVAALLPAGQRALVVPLEVTGLPVSVGDRVDLLSTGSAADPAGASAGPGIVAAGALVLDADDEALVVAVPTAEAQALATALGQGPLVPALVGPHR